VNALKSAFRGALFPSAHRTVDKLNGEVISRRIIAAPVTACGIDFPFAAQVFKIQRIRSKEGKKTEEIVCGITSLSEEEADEHRLLALNREHWSIENKLHLPRDTTYREDHSRIRKHHGAHALATLKNLAIGLHALGVFNTRKSPCKTLPKMNRKLARFPQIAINFCITPCNKSLMRRTE
jgi:predicted transposase YbfD/YdcC